MLVEVDHSGLEWRTYVFLSQDKVALDELNHGYDVHNVNQKFFKLPTRRDAKFFLFRVIYCPHRRKKATAWAFARDPIFAPVSTKEKYWEKVIDAFYEKYSDLRETHEEYISEVESNGGLLVVESTKRSYQFVPAFDPFNGGYKWPITKIANYPNQGLGQDIVAITRRIIYEKIKPFRNNALLCNTVHDSVVLDVPDELVYNICLIAEEACAETPAFFKKQFGVEWNVPLLGECKYGVNWKEMTTFKKQEMTNAN